MRGRTPGREVKLMIVRQLASREKRPAQVCREHNLAASMIFRWRQEYELHGATGANAVPSTRSQRSGTRTLLWKACGGERRMC
jgi:transposase-like protein